MKGIFKPLMIVLTLLISARSYAGVSIGADIYSRYVWRGTDFGNSVSVQPLLSYSFGGFEVGAWASYPMASDVTSMGANENDLYLTYTVGDLGLTITDYYFPESGGVFNYNSDDEYHFLESSLSYAPGSFSLLVGYFFSGDSDRSIYVEMGYKVYKSDEIKADLSIGAGNGSYVVKDEFGVVNIALTVSSGPMSVSYIVNPDAETNFLVVGYSFQ